MSYSSRSSSHLSVRLRGNFGAVGAVALRISLRVPIELRWWHGERSIHLRLSVSMSRVAVACGCDVSQVSRRIAAFEKEVGYPLFERSTRASRRC